MRWSDGGEAKFQGRYVEWELIALFKGPVKAAREAVSSRWDEGGRWPCQRSVNQVGGTERTGKWLKAM